MKMKAALISLLLVLTSWVVGAGSAEASWPHDVCYAQTDSSGGSDSSCTEVDNLQQAWGALHTYEAYVAEQGWYDAFVGYSDTEQNMDSDLVVLYERHTACTSSSSTRKFYKTGDVDGRLVNLGAPSWGMHYGISSLTNASDWMHGDHCAIDFGPYGAYYAVKTLIRCDSWSPMPTYYDSVNSPPGYVNLNQNIGPVELHFGPNCL